MLVPKRVKHRKVQRGSMKGKAKGGTRLNHGEYGIQALEAAWITNRQIEAARIAMTRYMKRGGKVWISRPPARRSSTSASSWRRARLPPPPACSRPTRTSRVFRPRCAPAS